MNGTSPKPFMICFYKEDIDNASFQEVEDHVGNSGVIEGTDFGKPGSEGPEKQWVPRFASPGGPLKSGLLN